MEVVTINSLDTLETNNYEVLKQGDVYALFLSVSNNYEFHVSNDMKLSLIVNEGIETSVMIYVDENVKNAYINVVAERDSSAKVFILNNSKAIINEEHSVKAYFPITVTGLPL